MPSLMIDQNRLIRKSANETIWIEPWGINSLRVRATRSVCMDNRDWALLPKESGNNAEISINEATACITCGGITAKINEEGWLSFFNSKGELLLQEYWRNRDNLSRYCVPLGISARELKPVIGEESWQLTARFEARDSEKIFGMGQYQDGLFDKKGSVLELAQRNTQASVPFYVSNIGYGFLWNNPAVGKASFGTNITEWEAYNTKQMDYWITCGDTPAQMLEQYSAVTGKPPLMPEYGLGLWQSKLRYRTQEELLEVAREYKRRGIPISVIVSDFFHWPMQGDWKFDERYWPDVDAMVAELKQMGVELMVSIWPTVDVRSDNYAVMSEKNYLVRMDRGVQINMSWMGDTVFYDATNPEAREYVWQCAKENYYDKGIKIFWLDEAEPEYGPYDFDIFRYHIGSALQTSNIYPSLYAKGFYDGMTKQGQENVLNLVRCAWAGSQKYGALVWSGDIYSNFRSMREQLAAGLSMAMAGIPWWTTDIGGFIGADIHSDTFKELMVRWLQWATFCPVMRMHGERPPFKPLEQEYINGVRQFSSGQENEIWSYGEEAYNIMRKYVFVREHIKPYISGLMQEAHEKGSPVMRPMLYEFPHDRTCWSIYDQYMFGPDLLVAPVMNEGQRSRSVYLPAGATWKNAWTGDGYEGGQTIKVAAPLDIIPIYIKDGADIPVKE